MHIDGIVQLPSQICRKRVGAAPTWPCLVISDSKIKSEILELSEEEKIRNQNEESIDRCEIRFGLKDTTFTMV
jgi:hypothetical protein